MAAVEALQLAVTQLTQRLDALGGLEERVAALERGGGGAERLGPRVQAVRKTKPPACFVPGGVVGREARWASWAFRFGGYFSEQQVAGEEFLEWVGDQKSEIKDGDLDDFDDLHRGDARAADLNENLYKELRQLCTEGEAYTIVRNMHKGRRGAEAWRRLSQRFGPGGAARAQSIEEELMMLRWPKDEDEAGMIIDTMEAKFAEWEKIKARPYPDDTKLSRLRSMIPERYRTEVSMNQDKYETYEQVRDFVLRMIQIKREDGQTGRDIHKNKPEVNPLFPVQMRCYGCSDQACPVWGQEASQASWHKGRDWDGDQHNQWDLGEGDGDETTYEDMNVMKGGGKGVYGKAKGKGVRAGNGNGGKGWYGAAGGMKGMAGGKGGKKGFAGDKGSGKGIDFSKGAWNWNPWGTGKAGGKGFQGVCHYCGEWGHSLKYCKWKDEEMAQKRAAGLAYLDNEDETSDSDGYDHEPLGCLAEQAGDRSMEDGGVYTVEAKEGTWVKEELLMDTGASSSFVRHGGMSHVPVKEPGQKERNRRWFDASGGEITNQGESTVKFVTEQGARKQLKMRRSEKVKKNIGSVSEMADLDNLIIFHKKGGAIIKDPGSKVAKRVLANVKDPILFNRNKNVYTLDMWIKTPKPDTKSMANRSGKDGAEQQEGMFVVDAGEYERFLEAQRCSSSTTRTWGFARQGQA